ncbi:hypothetical protein [Nonomuraea sp. NPDC049625]|uniref:hypothetical protein n=1 Tax=Nonomuraea sp. NPDC049625 TaxID=3155775 RepID=UPI003435920C
MSVVDPQYAADARRIWQSYVPPRGQADTVQGELLRAVEKLRNEAQRNGNINWSDSFERLQAFLRSMLVDPTLFDEKDLRELIADLDRLADYERPAIDDAPFDRLTLRVVDWCRAHPEPMEHPHDPMLFL